MPGTPRYPKQRAIYPLFWDKVHRFGYFGGRGRRLLFWAARFPRDVLEVGSDTSNPKLNASKLACTSKMHYMTDPLQPILFVLGYWAILLGTLEVQVDPQQKAPQSPLACPIGYSRNAPQPFEFGLSADLAR